MTSRGIRNNNPGNIRHGEPWQGLSKEQTDKSFCQFISPEYGIRAIVKILMSYQSRGLDTIQQIISTWAPSNENNTEAYIKAVEASSGLDSTMCLNLQSKAVIEALVKAIILHENGEQPYSDDIIMKGIDLAI